MSIIIDELKREIQKIKMELSEQIEENVRLKGFKTMVLEKPDNFDTAGLVEENRKLKKRAEEAEGENTIIKGIGNNSPEMRELQDKLKESKAINKLHQELNGKLQVEITELKEDNKNLALQIEDKVNAMRKSGM